MNSEHPLSSSDEPFSAFRNLLESIVIKKVLSLKLAIVVVAILPAIRFIEINRVKANPSPAAGLRSFSAVSLNLAKVDSVERVVLAIRDAPRLRGADVFLFQEVSSQDGKPSVADETARSLGYSVAFAAAPGFSDQGLAIVSRYPLKNVQVTDLKACDLRFRSRKRLAIEATIQTPWGNVRVWNVHLDTRINADERLEQLRPVLREAARHTGPKLIGGDFNTNNFYWWGKIFPLPLGPAHSSVIRDAMSRHGFDTPFSRRVNTFPLLRSHLDWIFVSGLKPMGASVEPARFSDHNAIWVGASL